MFVCSEIKNSKSIVLYKSKLKMIGFVPDDQFIDHLVIVDFFGEFLEAFVQEITAVLQRFIHGDKVCIRLVASLISTFQIHSFLSYMSVLVISMAKWTNSFTHFSASAQLWLISITSSYPNEENSMNEMVLSEKKTYRFPHRRFQP